MCRAEMCRRKFFNVLKCADRLIVQQRNTRNNQTLFVCFVFYYTQDTGIVGTWKMAVGCQSSSWRNSIHASHPTIRVSWRVCVTSMAIVTRVCDRYNGSARTAMKRAAKAARLKKRVNMATYRFTALREDKSAVARVIKT